MTFKQKVEEIQCKAICGEEYRHPDRFGECEFLERHTICKEAKLAVDRILAAYKEAVEGMPHDSIGVNTFCDPFSFNQGAISQRVKCKEHLTKEMGDEVL